MKKILKENDIVTLLILGTEGREEYFLSMEEEVGKDFLLNPEKEEVEPVIDYVIVTDDEEVELDLSRSIQDMNSGEQCHKIVGGRPRNVSRRKK